MKTNGSLFQYESGRQGKQNSQLYSAAEVAKESLKINQHELAKCIELLREGHNVKLAASSEITHTKQRKTTI